MNSRFDPRVKSVLLFQENTLEFKKPVDEYFGGNAITLLSPRRRDVVRLIGKGYSNQGIAQELKLSIKRVENYINDAIGILDLVDRQKYSVRVMLALASQTSNVV